MKLPFLKKRSSLSDNDLIAEYKRSGDADLVGVLFQRYAHLVSIIAYNYLKNSADTEDALMEIFEIAMKDLKTHEVINFKPWIYSVTKNHCLKVKHRRGKTDTWIDDVVNFSENFMEFEHDNSLNDNELNEKRYKKAESALLQIPEEQKRCIELFYMDDKSYKEIVSITGFSDNQVKSFIQNGKRNLKNLIDE